MWEKIKQLIYQSEAFFAIEGEENKANQSIVYSKSSLKFTEA